MSERNVELYRQGIEAFNRRDLEGFLALADPHVVGVSRVLAIEGESYQGHDGTRRWWEDLLGVFPDFTIQIVWVRDAGDLTVSELRNSTRGEGSAALEELVWQVSQWRDGQVVRWQMYDSEQEALEAAGLRE
ncbi:MAG TPA: nuclear transport factor 2 family protein [Solirubrobacterales bacterium]